MTATVVRTAARSRVYVDDHLVFSGAGAMHSVAFSPDEQWLVVDWASADQLVFVRVRRPKLYAVSNVARQFGASARVDGWCCS
jgi:hypothetical protein